VIVKEALRGVQNVSFGVTGPLQRVEHKPEDSQIGLVRADPLRGIDPSKTTPRRLLLAATLRRSTFDRMSHGERSARPFLSSGWRAFKIPVSQSIGVPEQSKVRTLNSIRRVAALQRVPLG
jgi:hypothetical protein